MSSRFMNKMKNGHARLPALAAAACGAACALFFLLGDGQDNGMGEWFDLFLGESAEPWQSAADPDADGLDNLAEYTLLTDPLNPDTDLDGWDDDIDADPLSRAVYLWGEPRFTRGSTNLYSRPPWALHGLAIGGLPLFGGAYGYAWTLFSQEDALLMPLDRAAFSNDLWLAAVASGGALSAGILDSNLVELAGPFPLAAASGPWLTNRLPLSAFAGAGAVSLRSSPGGAEVVASLLYIDTDGDGFDDSQNAQLDAEPGAGLPETPPTVSGGVPGAVSARSGETNAPPADPGTGQSPARLAAIGFKPHEGYAVGPIHGQQGWTAEGAATVSAGHPFEGLQHLAIQAPPENGLTQTHAACSGPLPDMTNRVVWLSMRAKIIPGGCGYEDIQNPGGAVSFALSAGRIVAFDGVSGTWKESARAFPGATGAWERVDILLDYAAKTYTLCLIDKIYCVWGQWKVLFLFFLFLLQHVLLIRNRFSGARAPARLPVRVRTQTG